MSDNHDRLKPNHTMNEADNSPAPVNDTPQEGLDFSASSDVREVIGSLPAENKKGTMGATQQQVVTKTPQERKIELLARLPKDQERAEKYMRRQVTQTLENQVEELENKLHHTSNFYEMNVILAKIRNFKDTLAELAHVAFEQLKSLWLQFVHNLSI